LDRYDQSLDEIEKAVVSYGGVQTARLETNMSWIGFCISVAPSLGFLGTVVGMVQAFDDIEKAGDISPTIVAGGMKVALITTVFGLIVALLLQVFYSYLVSKIDSLTNTMEDATINYMDIVVKYKQ
jgi:biopolymer transport protein ExbB